MLKRSSGCRAWEPSHKECRQGATVWVPQHASLLQPFSDPWFQELAHFTDQQAGQRSVSRIPAPLSLCMIVCWSIYLCLSISLPLPLQRVEQSFLSFAISPFLESYSYLKFAIWVHFFHFGTKIVSYWFTILLIPFFFNLLLLW